MWVVLLGASLFLLSFVNSKYDQITLKKISVDFNADYKHDFITKKEVKEHLSDIGLQIDESLKKDIDLNRIENIFSNHPGVKKAEVFFINKNKGGSRTFFVGLSMSTNLGKLVDILSFVDILSASRFFLVAAFAKKVP